MTLVILPIIIIRLSPKLQLFSNVNFRRIGLYYSACNSLLDFINCRQIAGRVIAETGRADEPMT